MSSIPGAAITSIKIAGVEHEFSALEVKEDVITMLLSLKKVRLLDGDEPQKAYSRKWSKKVTAGDIETVPVLQF